MTPKGRKIYDAITSDQVEWVSGLSRRMNVRIQQMRDALDVLRKLGAVLETMAMAPAER
jgi:hypothetical protein